MQVQRVGSPNAAIAAQEILLDTRAKLYGLLARRLRVRRRPADDAVGRRRPTLGRLSACSGDGDPSADSDQYPRRNRRIASVPAPPGPWAAGSGRLALGPGAKMSENRTPASSSEAARGLSAGSAGPASSKHRTTGSWSRSIALWSCCGAPSSRCSCAIRCGA